MPRAARERRKRTIVAIETGFFLIAMREPMFETGPPALNSGDFMFNTGEPVFNSDDLLFDTGDLVFNRGNRVSDSGRFIADTHEPARIPGQCISGSRTLVWAWRALTVGGPSPFSPNRL